MLIFAPSLCTVLRLRYCAAIRVAIRVAIRAAIRHGLAP